MMFTILLTVAICTMILLTRHTIRVKPRRTWGDVDMPDKVNAACFGIFSRQMTGLGMSYTAFIELWRDIRGSDTMLAAWNLFYSEVRHHPVHEAMMKVIFTWHDEKRHSPAETWVRE